MMLECGTCMHYNCADDGDGRFGAFDDYNKARFYYDKERCLTEDWSEKE